MLQKSFILLGWCQNPTNGHKALLDLVIHLSLWSHLLLFHFPPVLWHPYYFVKKEDTFIFVFCPRSSFCLGSSSPICEYVPPATSFKSLINISWNTVWTIALKLHLFPTVPIPFTLMHFMTNYYSLLDV